MEGPHVTKVYLRSDNAGCYHTTELLLSLKSMGDRHGVVIERYDFSDPQSGEEVRDRSIAPMKTHNHRWVNEGHDITTAREMKIALESYGGVRGWRFAVVEIDKTQLNARVKKIPGISLFNKFQFVEEGVLSEKAYQIGKGHFYPYSSVVNNAQGATAINVVVAFSSPSGSSGAVAGDPSSSSGLFSCAEDGCVKIFSNYEELQHHLDAECHLFIDAQYQPRVKGWALKTVQRSTRMPDHVRS